MNVVVFGAGLSSTFLIQYLEENASEHNWNITVIDNNSSNIKERVKSKNTKTIIFDIHNEETLNNLIQNANLAISMLPARLHLDRSYYHNFTCNDLSSCCHICW